MGALRRHITPHEVVHQYRHQSDGDQGGTHNGEGLGEGQRVEQFSLLSLQHEYRYKGEHDDRQGEENRRHFAVVKDLNDLYLSIIVPTSHHAAWH